MQTTLRSWARLLRIPLAPTAAWDVVACLAFGLAAGGMPLGHVYPSSWLLLVVTSLLIYAMGMALNDLADVARDRKIAPDRPLPSRAIPPAAAGVAVVLLATGAIVLGGGKDGTRVAVAAAVVFAVAYDVGLKRFLVPGVVTMGMTRFANASIGVWPLVLGENARAPWWVLLGPAAVGLYSAAVTLLSTTEDVFAPARAIVARVLSAAAFLLVAILPWIAVGHPTLGVLIGGGVFTSIVFGRRPKDGPVKRQVLEMLLGLYFLSMCLATAGDGGSLLVNGIVLVAAFFLIWLTQVLIRALR